MSGNADFRFEGDKSETYEGNIDISFPKVPVILLTSIEFRKNASWLERFAVATQKRTFTLAEDWKIGFDRIKPPSGLNGVVTIPVKHNNEDMTYDGASVPFPWLVSLLSIGALRPLGVLLIPSIVHDFAFRFGELLVAPDAESAPQVLKIERDEADALFYNMIRTLNGDILTAMLAWLAVRIGWVFVRYNGKRFGGKPPLFILLAATVGLLGGGFGVYRLAQIIGSGWTLAIFAIAYLLTWLGTILVLKVTKAGGSPEAAE